MTIVLKKKKFLKIFVIVNIKKHHIFMDIGKIFLIQSY